MPITYVLSIVYIFSCYFTITVAQTEVQALCDLYTSLQPGGWSSPCAWNGPCNQSLMDITPGVNCTDDHVCNLVLSSSLQTGTIPTSISAFTQLTSL